MYICQKVITMSKRVTALFFILIANFILLAHAVVPHNHHHGQICVKDSHEQVHKHIHEQNTVEHSHDEDENSDTDNCTLKQIFITRAFQIKQECKCVDCHENHDDFVPFQALLYDVGINHNYKFKKGKAKIPDILFAPLRFVYLGIGLRAPPLV